MPVTKKSFTKYNLTEADVVQYATEDELSTLTEGAISFFIQRILKDPARKQKLQKLMGVDEAELGKMTYLSDQGFRLKYKDFLTKRGINTFDEFQGYIDNIGTLN
jgi:hypothetical protein